MSNEAAVRRIKDILKGGTVSFSSHALNEMQKDALVTTDVTNVLRGGMIEFSEEVNRIWRYRIRTTRITVVVAFRSEQVLTVVTAWRKTR